MGARVRKWGPGVLGARFWARASSAHRTALAPCLGWPWFHCCCGVASFFCSLPPQLPCERQSTGVWSSCCLCYLVEIAKGGGKFWILCFSLTYLRFTHFLVFPIPIIKIHLSNQLQPSSSNRESFSCQSPLQRNYFSHTKICGQNKNHLVLTSSPCSQWDDYRAFSSWQSIPLFFSRIIEVHEDFPQRGEIHKGTVRDRGNGLHTHLPWGWFVFSFMCDGPQSAPEKKNVFIPP